MKTCQRIKVIESKSIEEIDADDVQFLLDSIKQSRQALNNILNTSAVCNAEQYGQMRRIAYQNLK